MNILFRSSTCIICHHAARFVFL